MSSWPRPPVSPLTNPGRYLSQSVSRWKNLSSPARTGAIVNPAWGIQYAWYEGACAPARTAVLASSRRLAETTFVAALITVPPIFVRRAAACGRVTFEIECVDPWPRSLTDLKLIYSYY